jgi:hypothetical protein
LRPRVQRRSSKSARDARSSLRRVHDIDQQAANPRFPDKIRELGLVKIICLRAFRLNKALIAQCMMVGTAAVHRDLGKHYGQNRVSYRGGCVGHESACVTGIRKRGERSNRRGRGRWTYRRSVARRRSGIAASAAAAGLLRAGAGLCRGACLPSRSRALLGWLWLASSPGPGLRLIAELFWVSSLNEAIRPPSGGRSV